MTTLAGTLALTTHASDTVKSAIGIVDASALRLREGPGTDTEILTTAYRNDYVVILESEGDWYKVIYNLREGYMHSDYLTVSSASTAAGTRSSTTVAPVISAATCWS